MYGYYGGGVSYAPGVYNILSGDPYAGSLYQQAATAANNAYYGNTGSSNSGGGNSGGGSSGGSSMGGGSSGGGGSNPLAGLASALGNLLNHAVNPTAQAQTVAPAVATGTTAAATSLQSVLPLIIIAGAIIFIVSQRKK